MHLAVTVHNFYAHSYMFVSVLQLTLFVLKLYESHLLSRLFYRLSFLSNLYLATLYICILYYFSRTAWIKRLLFRYSVCSPVILACFATKQFYTFSPGYYVK